MVTGVVGVFGFLRASSRLELVRFFVFRRARAVGVGRGVGRVAGQGTPLFVFDGDCAFCTRSANFVKRRVACGCAVEAWQRVDVAALGLTTQQCQTAVQWVDGDGVISSGHVAIARLLIVSGGCWGFVGRLLLVPGFSHVAAVVYRWVARNRHRLPGGSAECKMGV